MSIPSTADPTLDHGLRHALRRQIQHRFGPLPDYVSARLDSAHQADLEYWLDQILNVPNLETLFPQISEWLQRIKTAEARGDLLQAYDDTDKALKKYPMETTFHYHAVLYLSRVGSFQQAEALWERYDLDSYPTSGPLYEKIASVGARLVRERGLLASGSERQRLLSEAARRYEQIHTITRGSFPAANAATLYLLTGHTERADMLAQQVLSGTARPGAHPYYTASDCATAALILGDLDTARAQMQHCAAHHGGNYTLLAGTRRQLRRICDYKNLPLTLLEPLRPPGVIHYTGHMLGSRLAAADLPRVRAEIDHYLDTHTVGFAFGGLACGTDILFVEALLQRNVAEIQIVLPFAIDDYKQTSVAIGGADWGERFAACLKHPQIQILFATQDRLENDTELFAHASKLAMGLAKLRADTLDTTLEQVAVWDGQPGNGAAGTAANVEFWTQHLQRPNHTIAAGNYCLVPTALTIPPVQSGHRYHIRAILFGDVKGFSRLSEPQVVTFIERIMTPLAEVLACYHDVIACCNTWGDGLFIVFNDIERAARCALELQACFGTLNPAALGLPETLALRLGGHAGPVITLDDPVTGQPNVFGIHVSKTARIEPITPPGEVYVTEEFAALLELYDRADMALEYMGVMPAAKDYGELRMYWLRRQPF